MIVWEKMDGDLEVEQGKTLADACKAANVERFVWSSLSYVSKGMERPFERTYQSLTHYIS
jgi:hypothetical protein